MGLQQSPIAPTLTLCSTAHPQALNISDHYPVEVELSWSVRRTEPLSLPTLLLLSMLLPLLPPDLGLVV